VIRLLFLSLYCSDDALPHLYRSFALFVILITAVLVAAASTISPAVAQSNATATVTITGNYLKDAVSVLFGTVAGAIVGIPTTTKVIVTTPAVMGPVLLNVSINVGVFGNTTLPALFEFYPRT